MESAWGRSDKFWSLSQEGMNIRSCLGALRSPGTQFDPLNGTNATVDSYLSYQSPTYDCSYCDYSVDFSDDEAAYLLMGWASGKLSWEGPETPRGKCLAWDRFGEGYCVSAVVYYDAACQLMPMNQLPARMCDAGYVLWNASPISLNFGPTDTLTTDMTFVRFPLHPGAAEDTWYTWKASEQHPLLVLDPKHTGSITSPYQLFGSWTFGGRSLRISTALTSSDIPPQGSEPWKHGYEPLATLDANNDQKISGEELRPLALWFDRNRNGISEAGEVQAVEEAGIEALYYEGATYDDSVDGYKLATAFERKEKGETIRGSAVDWFSPGDRNKDRLVAFESFRSRQKAKRSGSETSSGGLIPHGRVNMASPFVGQWEWTTESSKAGSVLPIGGILKFLAYKSGDILGVSIAENAYIQPYPVNSEVTLRMFRGSVSKPDTVEFSLSSDAWDLRSTAVLADDKETLHGETTATSKEENRSFRYSWTAKRTATFFPKSRRVATR